MNSIQIYKNNSYDLLINISGITNLSAYTAHLTVKDDINSSAVTFTISGTTTDYTILFNILPEHTDIQAKTYNYDIIITNGSTYNRTIEQDILTILKSVKNY